MLNLNPCIFTEMFSCNVYIILGALCTLSFDNVEIKFHFLTTGVFITEIGFYEIICAAFSSTADFMDT